MRGSEGPKIAVGLIVIGFGLGVSLLAYAHSTFATKDTVELIFAAITRIENKLDGRK